MSGDVRNPEHVRIGVVLSPGFPRTLVRGEGVQHGPLVLAVVTDPHEMIPNRACLRIADVQSAVKQPSDLEIKNFVVDLAVERNARPTPLTGGRDYLVSSERTRML